jgi:hypothetical protein
MGYQFLNNDYKVIIILVKCILLFSGQTRDLTLKANRSTTNPRRK